MRERDETAGRHRFNTDLLVNPGDLDTARAAFPRTFHVLDHAALRPAFLRYDGPAKAAKRRGRISGVLAIGFGLIALFTAAASPSARWQGLVAAVCGLISIAVGLGGVLYAGTKRRWLLNRVCDRTVTTSRPLFAAGAPSPPLSPAAKRPAPMPKSGRWDCTA